MISRYLIAIFLAATLAPFSRAGDWPQFKGPGGSGVSDEAPLPTEWSKDKGIRWKAALPSRGVSSPVVVGGHVYVTCSSGTRDDRLHTLCFDAQTGKELWHRQFNGTGGTACHPKTCMAAPTPVADETGVYALFATGDLAAYDADGTLRWYRSLVADYPTISNQIGMAASPILVKDRLIVPMDNVGESFIAALDIRYGKNLWKADRPKEINWVTPVVRTVGGKTEVLFSGPGGLVSYDLDTGSKRWSYKAPRNSIPTSVLDGSTLYLPEDGVTAVKLGEDGVIGKPLWKATHLQMGMASPLVYGGKIYAAGGDGFISCGDVKSGKQLYKERTKGAFSASPVAGDKKVYFLNEKGLTTVLNADSDTMETLAANDLGDEETLATPAIAGGRIYIRTKKSLYCIGEK